MSKLWGIMAASMILAVAGCGGDGSSVAGRPATTPPLIVVNDLTFFTGFTGEGLIPSAARAPLVNDSPEASPVSDSFPEKATFNLVDILFVNAQTIRGLVLYADPAASLASEPHDFSDTGKDYPTRLVCQPSGSLALESAAITYYSSGYRNEPFHERSWWAVIAGRARVNGVEGYTFAVYIDDGVDPNDPTDTRTGKDYFAIAIYAPGNPYGWAVLGDGSQRWGVSGVVYYNQYYVSQGDIDATGTPSEPVSGSGGAP